jgi:CRP-like cAMP-binding protein
MQDEQFLRKHLLDYFERGQEVHFAKDEIIIRPEEEPGGIYLLKSGFVASYTITNYGETNILTLNQPGEVFPLSATLGGRLPTTYRQAKTDITVKRVSRAAFIASLQTSSTLSQAVSYQLLDLCNSHEGRIKELEFRTARERIMARFYLMCGKYGTPREDGILLNVPFTHQDLADSLNMTRETASREIERLARDGVIERDGRSIVVKKIDVLKKLFD